MSIATGSIMGIQQMFMNAGQAIGPMIGAWLFSINMYVPWLYLFAFEVCSQSYAVPK